MARIQCPRTRRNPCPVRREGDGVHGGGVGTWQLLHEHQHRRSCSICVAHTHARTRLRRCPSQPPPPGARVTTVWVRAAHPKAGCCLPIRPTRSSSRPARRPHTSHNRHRAICRQPKLASMHLCRTRMHAPTPSIAAHSTPAGRSAK
eukprot:3729406-Prymnesium_polylepis.5